MTGFLRSGGKPAGLILTLLLIPASGFLIGSPFVRLAVLILLSGVAAFLARFPAGSYRSGAGTLPENGDDASPRECVPVVPGTGSDADSKAVVSGSDPEPPAGTVSREEAGRLRSIIESVLSRSSDLKPIGISTVPEEWDREITVLEDGSRFISENVKKAFDIADNLSKTAQEAFDLSENTQKGIRNVTETLGRSLQQADLLFEQSAQISKILELMSDVSAKTHVLSINASIVSARAGTQGKAFDVVAREIRNLAHETEQSLAEIDRHIREIKQSIVTVVDNTRTANEKIALEKNSLMSVAGTLQGAILAVEVIRTVSSVAREKTEDQRAVFAGLRGMLSNLHALIGTADSDREEAAMLVPSLREILDALVKYFPEPDSPARPPVPGDGP